MEQLNRRKRRSLEKGTRKHNNRKNDQSTEQIIWSQPKRIFVGKYLTEKGKRLLANHIISKEDAWIRYGKNRYAVNLSAIALKTITHKVYHIQY